MSAAPPPALVLTRSEISTLMSPADYLEAAEQAFVALHEGKAVCPPPLALETALGGFHAKAAALTNGRSCAALKLNANFPGNRSLHGLPTIQGAILLCDGETGSLLAIMDSAEVTLRRTAAATALAARHLARPESEAVLICGCGDQAGAQLEALRAILPLRRGWCWDTDPARAESFALATDLEAAGDLKSAALAADVIVTCTTATAPFLAADMVRPGTFIAAVGADNPHKSEIAPELMAGAVVVCDSADQCAAMGDLHHALEASAMTIDDVHAELGQLAVGAKAGRSDKTQFTLFDSTGVAVQDVAAAAQIYERAVAAGAAGRIMLAV